MVLAPVLVTAAPQADLVMAKLGGPKMTVLVKVTHWRQKRAPVLVPESPDALLAM